MKKTVFFSACAFCGVLSSLAGAESRGRVLWDFPRTGSCHEGLPFAEGRMAARRLALYDIVPYAPGHEAETARDIRETRATAGIDTFPNFAAYRIRFTLAFRGCLPVSKQLPFEWYDTPNIHCVTLKDFKRLCDKEGIEILEVKAESRHFLGKLLLALGFKNLGASKIIARIARMRD